MSGGADSIRAESVFRRYGARWAARTLQPETSGLSPRRAIRHHKRHSPAHWPSRRCRRDYGLRTTRDSLAALRAAQTSQFDQTMPRSAAARARQRGSCADPSTARARRAR